MRGLARPATGGVGPFRERRRHPNQFCANSLERFEAFRRNGAAFAVEGAQGGCDSMTFRPQRFPDRIVRRRQEPGTTNAFGEFVEGSKTEVAFAASVQPMALEDADIAGGVSLQDRRVAFVPEENALLAAFEDRQADQVIFFGTTFVVEESRSWPGSHTRATLLRET